MLLHLNEILTPAEVAHACEILAQAPWADGKATSGPQAARVKNNAQLPEACAATQRLQDLVLQGLQRHQVFFSAALPKHISPPLFNRYAGAANSFGDHVDSAVRYLRNGERIRSDISCTLFLSAPDAYAGGELVVTDSFADHRIKLAAGDMLLYPGNTVHRVEAVTRGARLACFFWIESMIRSHEQRRLLFDMDRHLIRLRSAVGETDPAVVGLTGTYHNLLRVWADT
jgi:PKHD-type hydroxylase